MTLIRNVPFFSILLCMITGVVSSILKGKSARNATVGLVIAVLAINGMLAAFLSRAGDSYTYLMGHFPAPWGNELRAGALEATMASVFSLIMLLSLLGGMAKTFEQIEERKLNLYFIMCDLMLAALMALIYTNDLFTAYVFIEILTIASCALIMTRQNGHCLVAATRYMVMNLLGSGLILIGITMLYGMTGYLLMSNIKQSVALLHESGQYARPLTVVIALMTVGLAIKSALFPFHEWLPDAYGYATPSSSAMLSSLISKGYIFLLIKIYFRVFGFSVVADDHMTDVLFIFGVVGVVMGSVSAIRQREIRRMIAFSSVAQIGYIYMGLGIGTTAGVVAALFHMIVHAAAKSMLFLSASALSDVSGDSKQFRYLRGSGYRNVPAGIAFTVGAMSMVGVPLAGGFLSKIYFAQAGLSLGDARAVVTLVTLAVSTLLNTLYFLHTVISIYRPPEGGDIRPARSSLASVTLMIMAVLNIALGVASTPLYNTLAAGLAIFG